MRFISFLLSNNIQLDVNSYKIHLATMSNTSPLEAFFRGNFKDWQEWQSRKNFECSHIVSLIQLDRKDTWLFAGVYKVNGRKDLSAHYEYETELLDGQEGMIGRVIVKHERTGRAAYLWGSTDAISFELYAILPERMRIEEFPGYNRACVPFPKLKTIVDQQVPSWKGALSNVKGIYLITDLTNGKKYVGKADSDSGIWQRWSEYVYSGHGGNKELRELLANNPPTHMEQFQFTVLEIADSHANQEQLNERESYWKRVLSCREHGYNCN
jgi:hypothetical protein